MDKFKQVKRILWVILALNWAVAIAKLLLGWLTHTQSVTADGFHSFSDGASNIIGVIGIWAASQPIDKEHPYGHKKFETFTSLGIAMLLFFVALNIVHEAIGRFRNPVIPAVIPLSFIIMVVTTLVNIAVVNYEARKGKVLQSDILVADSKHTKADILVSCSVIVTLLLIKAGLPQLDIFMATVIAFLIGYNGFEVLKSGTKVLCDEAVLLVGDIEKVVLGIEGVVRCHQIRTRGREDDVHVDLHVLVAPQMQVKDAHNLSYRIENEIKRHFQGVTDVVVHIEPA